MTQDARDEARELLESLPEDRLPEILAYLRLLGAGGDAGQGLGAVIGLDPVSRGEGKSSMAFEAAPHLKNPHGVLHGGVLFAAMDTAMGGALMSVLAEEELCATIEGKVNFVAPVLSGRLTASAEVVRRGGRIAVMEARTATDSGDLVALMTATFMVQKRPGAAVVPPGGLARNER